MNFHYANLMKSMKKRVKQRILIQKTEDPIQLFNVKVEFGQI